LEKTFRCAASGAKNHILTVLLENVLVECVFVLSVLETFTAKKRTQKSANKGDKFFARFGKGHR
jgi:hypothetical protein